MAKRSIVRAARRATRDDASARMARTADSLQNFAANLGIGLDNAMSSSTYGFNPITRVRTLLEWIHRGSWLGGVAIDVVADDMTRAGVDIRGDLDPKAVEHLEQQATALNLWGGVNEVEKWARLYGGAIGVLLVEGQNPSTPLRVETVGKNQFKGVLVLDRWMVEPSLNDLVTEFGPDLGLPKFYSVTADAPALPRMKIHYSRVLRREGIRLPYTQRMMENLWGISVLERLYDRMVAFDSASTGAAQLVYKAYLRVYKIDGMREIIGAGGPGEANLIKFVEFMRRMQSVEGITLIDAKDDLAAMAQPSFAGLSDALIQFGQQLGGALQIPLTRLFGQSPVGMNATGESDLRTYYDGIKQQQNRNLLVPVTRMYRALAASEGVRLPDSFSLDFRSLWVLSDTDKAGIAAQDSATITGEYNAGMIRLDTALKEKRQLSKTTGRGTNISDQEIAEAGKLPSGAQMAAEQHSMGLEQGMAVLEEPEPKKKANGKAKDSMLGAKNIAGLPVVIEHDKNDIRYGVQLPAAYGYIRRTDSAEPGDQMDCFVGADPDSGQAYIVNSYKRGGRFDEHKVMLGYVSAEAAQKDFDEYYGKLGGRRGEISEVSTDELRSWLKNGPVSEPYMTQ